MGGVIHTTVDSSTDLLRLLGCQEFSKYQQEFSGILQSDPTLAAEDWSSEPELLEVFYCLTRERRPQTILEIGTYVGRTAFLFACALERNQYGRIFTVDNNESGVLPQAKARFAQSQLNDRTTLIERSSQDAFANWVRTKIDILFIDGSHSYLDASADFALWSRHISVGGIIVMHDTVTYLMHDRVTDLERRFPEDYIHPLAYYDVLNVVAMKDRPSGHQWEGVAFITLEKGSG